MTKNVILLLAALFLFTLAGCRTGYDAETCRDLSERIATDKPLSQDDYAEMIEQSSHILDYLVQSADSIAALPDADRRAAAASMRSDRTFLERFDYMFTFSSVLYRAHLRGQLSPENSAAYEHLDRTSTRLARLTATL